MDITARPNATGSSPGEIGARLDLDAATSIATLGSFGRIDFDVRRGARSLWVVAKIDGRDACALRAGFSIAEIEHVQQAAEPEGGIVCEFVSSFGAVRTRLRVVDETQGIVRCTTWLLPARDVIVGNWPRDLFPIETETGTVHTSQRGLRSGIVFASAGLPTPYSLFYLQDFSSLNDYFAAVGRSPADAVSGRWPELGYAPPGGDDCLLRVAREVVISDAYLTLTERTPPTEAEAASLYLDMLADTYLCLPRDEPEYHDWPMRAERTLRDLSLSPDCTYVRDRRRYLKPYVGDDAKPPESMVQFTVGVNTLEYERWRGEPSVFGNALRATVPDFFNAGIGTIVRWLPGQTFDDAQAESNMSHEAMDSWYLHHALFNTWRLAREGDAEARRAFETSLPFVVRVARRFAYRWPIFFNLETLDIIRGEAGPGKGGETDVGGLYALVMLHAYEMFGAEEYLSEAKRAVESLHGLGFTLAYQLNTTGFAAEATLRLFKLTGDNQYLALSEICMANLFDNMWLWKCDYAHALHYRPFFGLFPLRDAPYIAPYEELEAQAKFHDYLDICGESIRPSLRLLLAEYQKYTLDRAWFYYPDVLPVDGVSDEPRNGRVDRGLSVPLEDLQDGLEISGQVGQELYGAGLPFVLTSRHYVNLTQSGCLAFCSYPLYEARYDKKTRTLGWRIGGDPRGRCELRIVPVDANLRATAVSASTSAGSVRVPLPGSTTAEGHALFEARGGDRVELLLSDAGAGPDGAVVIGAIPLADR